MSDYRHRYEPLPDDREREAEELPLPVVPDWDAQVQRADCMCRLIDRHLEYEARNCLDRQRQAFLPQHLCPWQRVQMLSDLRAVIADEEVRRGRE